MIDHTISVWSYGSSDRPPAPARQTSAVADINAAGLSLATAPFLRGVSHFGGGETTTGSLGPFPH